MDRTKTVEPITAQSALNKLKRKIPYGWDLNIYRGCEHACQYCYAMYSHKHLGDKNFFQDICVKENIVELLEKELSADSWQREVINIGGVTDSYQPAEQDLKLMPQILKLLIKYKTPAIISTKSNLVLRDYDLIDELSRITYVNIAATITTMDGAIREKVEPGSATSIQRFEVLKTFRKTNASTGLHVMPIIPRITDNESNFTQMFEAAKTSNVHYVLPGTLYLRGSTRKHFFAFIEREFPHLTAELSTIYKTGGADKAYKTKLYEMVNRLRTKYNLSSSYMAPMKEKLPK
ncbi:SPL family radical SAM protein [Dethiobacter alkaliphilus]|uniref:Radical SAM domain protein n=1 Tax=Dethiobacter alkaliphilus AHT 1 TaxID=555088 RepID=C0GD10_DETAL|nr:radical SAM protein [Dethiobacter alkaliphilus]EEG79095.1 Radical SAM domain protein [Dethiobacter alkaliphilus AHT 1]